VSDEPPQQPPPQQPTVPPPTAADAAQARDSIEEAARAVFTAALVWYILHGDDPPDDDSQVMAAARLLANRLLRSLRKQSATPPPVPTGAARGRWVDEQAARIVKEAVDEAGSHYSTVFRRLRKEDPLVSDQAVKATFADDKPWAHAAARTTATRLAAETVLSMRGDVERITGDDHSAMWISRGDPKVRSLHRDLHGRVRPVGDPFHTWPDGQTLNYPGDMTAPIEAWVNCRCALMLVPSKDAAHAEEVFSVPNLPDFDVPMAAAGPPPVEVVRAERELRAELGRRLFDAAVTHR
jgi:hypothetical protein